MAQSSKNATTLPTTVHPVQKPIGACSMTHQRVFKHKPQLFRVFVTTAYYANRDEYDSAGQQQPYTFEQYANNNMQQLRRDFKLHKRTH